MSRGAAGKVAVTLNSNICSSSTATRRKALCVRRGDVGEIYIKGIKLCQGVDGKKEVDAWLPPAARRATMPPNSKVPSFLEST